MNVPLQRRFGISVTLVCAGMALMACLHACTHHNAATASQVPAAFPIQSISLPGAKEIYELREKCAADSRVWFKDNFPDPEPAQIKGGGGISSLPASYENHYSPARNGCFAIVSGLTTVAGKVVDTLQTAYLWNVMDNSQIGTYIVKDSTDVTTCEVTGVPCASKDEWSALIAPYFAD